MELDDREQLSKKSSQKELAKIAPGVSTWNSANKTHQNGAADRFYRTGSSLSVAFCCTGLPIVSLAELELD